MTISSVSLSCPSCDTQVFIPSREIKESSLESNTEIYFPDPPMELHTAIILCPKCGAEMKEN